MLKLYCVKLRGCIEIQPDGPYSPHPEILTTDTLRVVASSMNDILILFSRYETDIVLIEELDCGILITDGEHMTDILSIPNYSGDW